MLSALQLLPELGSSKGVVKEECKTVGFKYIGNAWTFPNQFVGRIFTHHQSIIKFLEEKKDEDSMVLCTLISFFCPVKTEWKVFSL